MPSMVRTDKIACPHCTELISPDATRCPRCTGEIDDCPRCGQNVPVRTTEQWKGVLRGGRRPVTSCGLCGKTLHGTRW